MYRAPKEKLTLIVNFSNFICFKYKLTDKTSIMKFIVFSLLKANIQNLKANLKFIGLFRHKTTISSEEDYFLSLMFQAVEFIEKLNPSHLKINKNQFTEYCDEFDKRETLKNSKNQKINLLNKMTVEDSIANQNLLQMKSGPVLNNKNDGILNLDTNRLHNEYFSNNFNENSVCKFENMYNDFKIILKMVESLKSDYKSNDVSNASLTYNKNKDTGKVNNLIDI